jgi:hypothetical protein
MKLFAAAVSRQLPRLPVERAMVWVRRNLFDLGWFIANLGERVKHSLSRRQRMTAT